MVGAGAGTAFFGLHCRETPSTEGGQPAPTIVPSATCDPTDLRALVNRALTDNEDAYLAWLVEAASEGLPMQSIFGALFIAGVENLRGEPGGVLHRPMAAVAAAQLASREGREHPLVAAAWAHERLREVITQSGDPLPPLADPQIPTGDAIERFEGAMQAWDRDGAEAAIVGVLREHGPTEARQRLWTYGTRHNQFIGHSTILTALGIQALDMCGWALGEASVRTIARGLLSSNPGIGQELFEASWGVAPTLHGLADGHDDDDAVVELIRRAREDSGMQMMELTAELRRAGVSERAIWTGVVCASAEIELRYFDSALVGVHAVDAANALHQIARQSEEPVLSTAAMLQSAAFLQQMRWNAEDINGGVPSELPQIDTLARDELAPADLDDLFTRVGDDRRAGISAALAWLDERGEGHELATQLRDRALQKAQRDAHDYKYIAALLEESALALPSWWPRLLAVGMLRVKAPHDPDWGRYRRTVEVLGPGMQ